MQFDTIFVHQLQVPITARWAESVGMRRSANASTRDQQWELNPRPLISSPMLFPLRHMFHNTFIYIYLFHTHEGIQISLCCTEIIRASFTYMFVDIIHMWSVQNSLRIANVVLHRFQLENYKYILYNSFYHISNTIFYIYNICEITFMHIVVGFKYDLGQRNCAPQVPPDQGSKSKQYISCQWDACSNHGQITVALKHLHCQARLLAWVDLLTVTVA